jgi:hypothetical protein
MPIIPSAQYNATPEPSALKLPRYAQIIRYDENAFFGINASTNRERAVRKIFTKIDRDMIARELGAAQTDIESVLCFPLGQKWFEGEQHDRNRRNLLFTKWAHVQALGARAVSEIAAGVALSHSADPATIPPTVTTVTDPDEIHFYEAGTDVEVFPSMLEVDGGEINASFPRARLVKESAQENPTTGWPYDNTGPSGPFIQELDIRRVYTDTENVGVFVWPLGKENCPECSEDTEAACGYIQSTTSGVVTLLPDPTGNCYYCGATKLRLNYCAGLPLDSLAEDAIIHLAHARMAVMPCTDSDPLMMLWKQDRFIPSDITDQRADARFGVQEGAWRAWVYATKNKHFRMTVI